MKFHSCFDLDLVDAKGVLISKYDSVTSSRHSKVPLTGPLSDVSQRFRIPGTEWLDVKFVLSSLTD